MIKVFIKDERGNDTENFVTFLDGTPQEILDRAAGSYIGAVLTVQQQIEDGLESYEAFGKKLIKEIMVENRIMGILAEPKVDIGTVELPILVDKNVHMYMVCEKVFSALRNGILPGVKAYCMLIPDNGKDIKYVTNARLLKIVNTCEIFMQLPPSAQWWV